MGDYAAVAIGGAVGTGLRLAVDILVPHGDSAFPLSTLVINVVGGFSLGVVVALLWNTAPRWVRAGLGAGLLGSFTTFSALAVSLVALGSVGEWMIAVGYLVASLALGLAAAAFGLRLGSRASRPVAIDLVDE